MQVNVNTNGDLDVDHDMGPAEWLDVNLEADAWHLLDMVCK